MTRKFCALGSLLLALALLSAAPAMAASMQQVSNWTGGVANLPSDVLMYVYVPDKVATNPPLLTLIHSCGSNASVVLGQAPGLKSAADQYGFIIVLRKASSAAGAAGRPIPPRCGHATPAATVTPSSKWWCTRSPRIRPTRIVSTRPVARRER